MAAVPEQIPQQAPPAVVDQEFIPGSPHTFLFSPLTAAALNLPDPENLSWEQVNLMRFDAVIDAATELLKDLVLAEGYQIIPATVPEDQKERAQELADFCARAFKRLQTSFRDTLEGMLEAVPYGYTIAEVIYENVADGEDRGRLSLKSIKLKDRGAVEFVVDEYWNILGLKATTRGDAPLLPRVKFLILSLRRRGEDPRGRTSFRSAFAPWRFKQELWPAWLRFAKVCAIPDRIGKLPPQATPQPKRDAQGRVVLGSDGKPVMLPAGQALLEALQGMENASVAVVANGTEIQQIETEATGEVFEKGIDVADQQMTTGLLRQSRATREAEHGSKADSETGRSLLSYLVANLQTKLSSAVTKDVIHPLVLWNFGPEALAFAPSCVLGDTERFNWSKDADAAAELAPFVTDSQWLELCTMLGLSPPQEGEEIPKRVRQAPAKQDEDGEQEQMPGKQPPRGKQQKEEKKR